MGKTSRATSAQKKAAANSEAASAAMKLAASTATSTTSKTCKVVQKEAQRTPSALLAMSMEALKDHLRTSAAGYDALLANRVEARFYVPMTAEQELVLASNFIVNKKHKAPKQDVKERTKKAKRLYYDPETAKTVVDLQAEKAAAADAAAAAAAAAPASTNADSADGDVSAPVKPKLYYARNATPLDASATVQEAGKALSHSLNAAPVSEKDVTSRLRDRIDELRSKRNLKSTGTVDKREAVANKRKKLKEKRKSETLTKAPPAPFDPTSRPKGESNAAEGTGEDKPGVVFSKFDFGDKKKQKKRPTPQQLLQKVEAEQQKLKDLAATDAVKAAEVEEKMAWSKAFQRAEGTKIVDDVKLVKKKIKRIEKVKAKSAKEWKERTGNVQKNIKAKQEKRNKNIQERSQSKLDRRRARAAKRRPGFVSGGVGRSSK